MRCVNCDGARCEACDKRYGRKIKLTRKQLLFVSRVFECWSVNQILEWVEYVESIYTYQTLTEALNRGFWESHAKTAVKTILEQRDRD